MPTTFAPLLLALLAAPPLAPEETALRHALMRQNLMQVAVLQPYLASPAAFRAPENRTAIDGALTGLAQVRHGQDAEEPGVAPMASLFNDELRRARGEFTAGQHDAARIRLRGLTGMCLACHSRTLVTKDFEDLGHLVDALDLAPLEKAELYAATRQFEKARKEWTVGLTTPAKDDSEAFTQAQALRQAVVTLVRSQENPRALLTLLGTQARRTDLPGFTQRSLPRWMSGVLTMQREDVDLGAAPVATLVDRARALLASTRAAEVVVPDDFQLVPNMRAAAMLQAALERDPTGPTRGEALYLLGVATATQAEPTLWQLDSLYLETCIRENPHTALAAKCVDRLGARLSYAYNGFPGGPLPGELAPHIGVLRMMAEPNRVPLTRF